MKSNDKTLAINGMDSYEFILGGNFILHRADVMIGDEKSETFEIIGPGEGEEANMNFFNSKGECGAMKGIFSANEFKITGDGIRFNGIIDEEVSLITGKWYLQSGNKTWNEFITLQLKRKS